MQARTGSSCCPTQWSLGPLPAVTTPSHRSAASSQVGNDEAIEFYRKEGFVVGETVKDYYQKLDVCDAVILSKKAPFVTPTAK